MDRDTAYRSHLERKTRSLHAGLARIGYAGCRPPIVSAPLEGGFRSRAKFKIFRDGDTCRVWGTDPVSGEVPIEDMLWILPDWARAAVGRLTTELLSMQGSFPVDGFEFRLAHGRRECHLTLSVKRGEGERSYEPLAAGLMSRVPQVRGVAVPSRRESFGDEWIRNLIEGREFHAHHSAFFQSHPGLTPRLLHEVAALSGGSKGRGIIDLYCGVGLFSLSLGAADTRILGVDNHAQAVESAGRNAGRMGFSRSRFVRAAVESRISLIDMRPGDLVLFDPPRSGCPAGTIRAAAAKKPREVCVISCFPQTQLDDLEVWRSVGYSLRRMSALDMFPFTEFLETVSLLEKEG